MISIINQNKWKLKSIDIKTAFLQGEVIGRNVYLRPHMEAKCTKQHIWKLKKCVYGLSDASLKWYQRIKNTMISLKGKISEVDNALFTWYKDGVLIGMIAVHVDDFLWSGNDYFSAEVIPQLCNTFSVGREEEKTFRYLGLNIQQHSDSIQVDQTNYIDSLESLLVNEIRQERMLSTNEKDILRSKIGQLLWVSNQTRPDISFDTFNLAVNINNATTKDIITLNKAVSKLKRELYILKFSQLDNPIKIVVYTDAAFGNLPDGGSQDAYLVFLVDKKNNCNIISWQSKRLKRIVRSTLAAETLAMCDGIDAALYIFCHLLWDC